MRFIVKFALFVYTFFKKAEKNELIYFANALTYKLLLALFPFIIFLMSLMGFFDISIGAEFITSINMPDEIVNIFNIFIEEVVYTRNVSLLSFSLLVSIVSASSGFRYIIMGINKVYGEDDKRNFIYLWIISIFLVVIFAAGIVGSLIVLIFGDAIKNIIIDFGGYSDIINRVFGMTSYILNIVLLFFLIVVIYKVSLCRKVYVKELIPGAAVTIGGWLLLSKIFNIYVNNFSRFSKIYGSIGSVFILMVWLNCISFLVLLGGQFNAIAYEKKQVMRSKKQRVGNGGNRE